MENEIKVNEFVRTKDGQIYKIEDGTEFYENSVNVGIGIIPDVDGIWVDKEHFTYVDKRDIVKHSPNLIDLIQVGDMVHIKDVLNEEWYWMFDEEMVKATKETIEQGIDLVEIVTKEMMESISYKVERKD